ncbi:ATP-binding cassette domain-containing protein [Saccharothrix sp. S26]|uniref:ATP-binding cassette domain-containing protein n=1 Tax=Saccharothrix sp. S26 TaxID=2907215 RepID=UPI001F1A3BAA|nr:ATP-binding cassette domain-containing protein [Saccharothrix sp. S26]MCE6995141.1 ATP-binding cassette domain-containing protein [Saccharothrix sp. S26]
MEPAIRAEGLYKRYGDHEALRGVDVTVPAGEVFGVLGPNGAGKTTTVRILSTLLVPDGGQAFVSGHDVVRDPRAVRRAIGLAGQYAAVDEKLTGRENLRLIGTLYRMGRRTAKARADELLERFSLRDAANRVVKTYSGGMRRRLDLAVSIIAEPAVMFLDEPTTGLDLTSRLALWEMIREQVARGATVLLTTQYLEEADQLADRIAVIDGGRVIAEGTPDELKAKVGGEQLEVTVAHHRDVPAVTALLGRLVVAPPTTSADGLTVSVPLHDGFGGVADAAAALRPLGAAVTDFGTRRPSLDDVFLALTGTTATPERTTP